jgi:hypothetical protein
LAAQATKEAVLDVLALNKPIKQQIKQLSNLEKSPETVSQPEDWEAELVQGMKNTHLVDPPADDTTSEDLVEQDL